MADFRLPDLGEGLTEASVVTWRVGVGDPVEVDQVVVEVETAKAAVELPVPFAGTVRTLHAAPGDTVHVGAALLTVDEVAAQQRQPDGPGRAGQGFREPGVTTASTEPPSGNVLIGYGTSVPARRARRSGSRAAGREAAASATVAAPTGRPAGPVPVISPLVRKRARDAGVDLASLVASGAGIVRRRDVEQAVAARAAGSEQAGAESTTARAAERRSGELRVPLVGVRKAVAEKLTRSRREIPEATVWVDVDATELLAARALVNSDDGGRAQAQVSLLALVARFTVLALRRYPELNAHLDRDEIVIPDHVNLGFAAHTDRGLVVPVVHRADRLSTRELSARLAELTRGARAGTLTPAELTGGTCTLNNYGVFGIDGSAAIINHPEAALVGIGRITDRPWVVDGSLAVRKVTQLTLAFDHRVCDGGTAGGFLRFLADCVESPVRALGDL